MFLCPRSFDQSNKVLWDGLIMISGLLEVMKMSVLFEFSIKTYQVWV